MLTRVCVCVFLFVFCIFLVFVVVCFRLLAVAGQGETALRKVEEGPRRKERTGRMEGRQSKVSREEWRRGDGENGECSTARSGGRTGRRGGEMNDSPPELRCRRTTAGFPTIASVSLLLDHLAWPSHNSAAVRSLLFLSLLVYSISNMLSSSSTPPR